MRKNLNEYYRPQELPQALALLRRSDVNTVPLAGATKLGLSRNPRIEAVIDLSKLGLDFIEIGAVIRLGAMTRLQTLVRESTIQNLADGTLSAAARREATYAVRNMATLGGCVAVAPANSELCTLLLVLDAAVELNGGEHRLPFSDYLSQKANFLAGSTQSTVI